MAQQADPHFCPNRPDLGSSTCITDRGRVLVEVSGADWQRDGDTDAWRFGDLLLRTGIDARTEVQFGWTPYALARADGRVVARGAGDVRIGMRRNLRDPSGEGLSIAVEGYAVLPVGARGIGDGDWSAGAALPVSVPLPGGWTLGTTLTGAAAVDADGDRRHAFGSAVLGLGHALPGDIDAVVELAHEVDDDPAGRTHATAAALSFAWHPRPAWQVDLLGVVGLSRAAPDVRLVVGGAILF